MSAQDAKLLAALTAHAAELDANDPLADFKQLFHLPENVIYLDGNSLGAMPKAVRAEMQRAIETEWAQDLITSWNKAGWWQLPITLGDTLAPLLGAAKGTVAVCDTTSINLFKLIAAAFSLRPDRHVLVTERGGFHTDLYITEGVGALRQGFQRRLIDDSAELPAALDEKVAVVLLSDVNYRTGAITDMLATTRLIQASGALVLWDLCHSAGVLPLRLEACGVDFAVGCSYKYLNGGPGAPAFLYVAPERQNATHPLTGWWGHAAPFAFEPRFRPADGIRRFLTGTQPVLSLRAMRPALELAAKADIQRVRAKSQSLTDFFIACTDPIGARYGMTLASPRDADQRGSQVSLAHPDGYAITQALIARGVIGDFRAPDILRFGFAPLYLSHQDALAAATTLDAVMSSGAWRDARYQKRAAVT